jgi:hypothetical protein
VNGYANLIAARLRKLAEEESTGMLPMSGRGDGAVFFRGGQVVYAESSRTSLPSLRTSGLAALGSTRREASRFPGSPAPGSPGPPGSPGEGHPGEAGVVAARSVSRLAGLLELTELIIDALAELLSTESRYAKFRPAEVLPVGQGRPMPVEALLSEVQRRHEVQRQVAAVLTPDTAVARHPSLDLPAAQVSPTQWSLLARAGDGTTPRGLAMQLGQSVFGTTIEVYRLLELGLLVVPGRPLAPADGRPVTGISFTCAASGGRGSDALAVVSERPDRRGTAADQAERGRRPHQPEHGVRAGRRACGRQAAACSPPCSSPAWQVAGFAGLAELLQPFQHLAQDFDRRRLPGADGPRRSVLRRVTPGQAPRRLRRRGRLLGRPPGRAGPRRPS